MEMTFLRADKNYMIHPDKFTFVRIDEQFGKFELAVPMYLWRYNSVHNTPVFVGTGGTAYKTWRLPLNKFSLEFEGGYESSVLRFDGRDDEIKLGITTLSYLYHNSDNSELLMGSFCRMKHGDITKQIRVEFPEDKENKPRFHHVPDLGRVDRMEGDILSWGISPNKYEVIYKGRTMYRRLAILCGVWCVVLTNRLEFDSVALLNAVDRKTLYVEQFLYSVNSRIVKAMVLMK